MLLIIIKFRKMHTQIEVRAQSERTQDQVRARECRKKVIEVGWEPILTWILPFPTHLWHIYWIYSKLAHKYGLINGSMTHFDMSKYNKCRIRLRVCLVRLFQWALGLQNSLRNFRVFGKHNISIGNAENSKLVPTYFEFSVFSKCWNLN